ncbi:hypothetical protein DFJ74DRAFT_701558 [Hyaloraphidium curvatum]|nr:hypothetical protein DFJ74DRAFT_701558 [Hyaloraphidium curvatum]
MSYSLALNAAVVQSAAEAGNAAALDRLGVCYREGKGKAQDDVRGSALYRRAADLGDPNGCGHLACAYFMGEGVPKSLEDGMHWLSKAEAIGSNEASVHNLVGCAYGLKPGAPPTDLATAEERFRRAAEMEDGWGAANLTCRILGRRYTVTNANEARKWFSLVKRVGANDAELLGFIGDVLLHAGYKYQALEAYVRSADLGNSLAARKISSTRTSLRMIEQARLTFAPIEVSSGKEGETTDAEEAQRGYVYLGLTKKGNGKIGISIKIEDRRKQHASDKTKVLFQFLTREGCKPRSIEKWFIGVVQRSNTMRERSCEEFDLDKFCEKVFKAEQEQIKATGPLEKLHWVVAHVIHKRGASFETMETLDCSTGTASRVGDMQIWAEDNEFKQTGTVLQKQKQQSGSRKRSSSDDDGSSSAVESDADPRKRCKTRTAELDREERRKDKARQDRHFQLLLEHGVDAKEAYMLVFKKQ